MLEGGVVVRYETIRRWCAKFGQDTRTVCVDGVRARATSGTSTRCISKIDGTRRYLWRAVDQRGNVLDVLVQSRRNALAANQFFADCSKCWSMCRGVIVTDKLASYQVAHREMLASVEHRRSK